MFSLDQRKRRPNAHTRSGRGQLVQRRRNGHSKTSDADSRKTISEVIRKQFTKPKESGETDGVLNGILRAVHLDQDWLEVTVDGKHEMVFGVGETVDDIIGPLINRRVIVQIVTQNGRHLKWAWTECFPTAVKA